MASTRYVSSTSKNSPSTSYRYSGCRLAEEERLESSPSTRRWWNLVQWVRQRLVDKGEVDGSMRGIWRITPAGRSRLTANTTESQAPQGPGMGIGPTTPAAVDVNLRDVANSNLNVASPPRRSSAARSGISMSFCFGNGTSLPPRSGCVIQQKRCPPQGFYSDASPARPGTSGVAGIVCASIAAPFDKPTWSKAYSTGHEAVSECCDPTLRWPALPRRHRQAHEPIRGEGLWVTCLQECLLRILISIGHMFDEILRERARANYCGPARA